jgi:hypothetical protein
MSELKTYEIYLYKPPAYENILNSWVYYRVGSIDSPEFPEGTLNATIETCRVSWPDFNDVGPSTWTTGITGWKSAADHIKRLVEGQYKVEHADVILIGLIGKDAEGTVVPGKIYPVGWTRWDEDFNPEA